MSVDGGFVVRVTGRNFYPGVTFVTIHSSPCSNVTVLDTVAMTVLQCTAPPGSGIGALVVTVDRGAGTISFAYPAPVVTRLSVSIANAETTDRIVVFGSNLAMKSGGTDPIVRTGGRLLLRTSRALASLT